MYNPYSLEGKTILVTGASSGIGKATALLCSSLGGNVIVTGRNLVRLQETFDSLENNCNQKHQMIVADITQTEEILKLEQELPPLNGVSDNAGMTNGNQLIKFLKDEDFETIFNTNASSHIKLAQILFKKKKLINNASYVLTASIGGICSFVPGQAAYGITKAAANSLIKYCAIEFAGRGIRCNAVCPGAIQTPILNYDTISEEQREADKAKYLLKRYGEPQEVAQTIVFLLSEAASFITGTSIIVDGGYSANH